MRHGPSPLTSRVRRLIAHSAALIDTAREVIAEARALRSATHAAVERARSRRAARRGPAPEPPTSALTAGTG